MKGNCTILECWTGAEWLQICDNTKVMPPNLEREVVTSEKTLDCKSSSEGCGEIQGQTLGTLKFASALEVELRTDPRHENNPTNQEMLEVNLRNCCATWYKITYPNASKTGLVIFGAVRSYKPGDFTADNDVVGTATISPVEDADRNMHYFTLDQVDQWEAPANIVAPFKGHQN